MIKTLKIIGEIFFFFLSLFFCFSFTYYFGWTLLVGPANWGNDLPFARTYISYLKNWYPPIPSWMYIWAGGMPFLANYPPLPTVITFFVHLCSGLTIQQSMRLLLYLSLPITALGISVLTRQLTKNWLLGILAGIMFFYSPDSFLWTAVGGFYAFSLSVPVFTWANVFYLWAISKKNKFFLILATFFYGITWLFHPMAGILETIFYFIFGLGMSFKKKDWFFFKRTLFIIFIGLFLVSFWLFPFYFGRASQGIGVSKEQMAYVTFKELLGLEFAHDQVYITSTVFNATIAILFIFGIVFSLIKRSELFFLSLTSFFAIFLMTAPGFARPITAYFLRFFEATGVRSTLILRVFGPILAAYGAIIFIQPIFYLIEKIKNSLKDNFIYKNLRVFFEGLTAFLVFYFLLPRIIIIPPIPSFHNWYYRGFGPIYNWLIVKEINGKPYIADRENQSLFPDIDTIFKKSLKAPFLVENYESTIDKQISSLAKYLNLTEKERVEVAPFSGALSGNLNNFTLASQIPAYVGVNLIQRMTGWQVYCFYYNPLCSEKEVEDLARWFGISYVLLGGEGTIGEGSSEYLKKLNKSLEFKLEKVNLFIDGESLPFYFYRFLNPTNLVSVTNKPVILVIGDNPPNSDVFDTVFRSFSKIDFGYKYAWSVKGKRFIDDYSLKELENFEIIILHGYQYKNKERAWQLLANYVKNGGNLFINNGWQYFTPEWGKEGENKGEFRELDLPEIFPVKKSLWGNIGSKWHLIIPEVSLGTKTENWGEPLWEGRPWGMSLAKKEWLKEDAKPLLLNDDWVLVAERNYGKGRVVWTGFNFFGHILNYKAPNEEEFFQKIFLKMINNNYYEEKIDFSRKEPDALKIFYRKKEEKEKLMFKEVAKNHWQAKLNGQRLKIYEAGPGWNLVFLPPEKESGEIIFKYQKPIFYKFGFLISWTTIILLIVYFLKKKEFAVEKKVKTLFFSLFNRLKKNWESDEY